MDDLFNGLESEEYAEQTEAEANESRAVAAYDEEYGIDLVFEDELVEIDRSSEVV